MTKNENFALANEISILTGKKRSEIQREDLIKLIIDKQIERITFHYTAIDGKLKELRIPITNKEQAEIILTEGERIDGSSLFKGMIDAGKSDLYVVPVYKTVFINPFDNTSLDFICRFLDGNGELIDFAPDNILTKAHNLFKKNTGLELNALGELEFFLIGDKTNDLYPMPIQRGYHATPPYTKTYDIIHEMLRLISQITDKIKYAHNEVGYIDRIQSDYPQLKNKVAEQVEVEFLPTPIEETADIMVLAAWIVRNVAYRHNMTATFYPKIDIAHAGNGLHFHNELTKDGKNIMTNKDGSLSDEARMFIGGLIKHATSLNAFGNMCTASYLRLVPHQEAPTKVCWSESNRSALIRVPLGWSNIDNLASRINPQQKTKLKNEDSRQTVELRSPDGSANVHMLLSGITMSAEWGLTHKEEALELANKGYVTGNIHSNPEYDNLPVLATSCVNSSEILLKNRNLFERDGIFPPRVIDWVADFLKNENDEDLNVRIVQLPEDEKLNESRRILHKSFQRH
jgi:glutamine synthetase